MQLKVPPSDGQYAILPVSTVALPIIYQRGKGGPRLSGAGCAIVPSPVLWHLELWGF